MYEIVDGICFLSGLAGFIYTLIQSKPQYCPIPISWIALYPLITQLIYNLCAKQNDPEKQVKYNQALTSRIVYHPNYNISFCGIEKFHPFDSQKYGNVLQKLIQFGIIKSQQQCIKPKIIPRSLLLQKMSACYLLKLNYTLCICSCIQMPLFFLPSFLLRWRVLNPMLLGAEGSILASIAAIKLNWAINLSGGYHHASCQEGGGFCIYPDITLIVHYLQTRLSIKNIMIIDLDAHQGNGHERDLMNRDDIFIVDAYNHNIYPGDRMAKKGIRQDIVIRPETTDEQFLAQVQSIKNSINKFKPEFVIYNAGSDCLIGDPLGNLSISQEGIIKRDEIVFRMCIKQKIPVVMLLSGGYQKINAQVIGKSIRNLYQKFDGARKL